MRRPLNRYWIILLAACWFIACSEEGLEPGTDQILGSELGSEFQGEASPLVDWHNLDPAWAGEDPTFEISIANSEEAARLFEDGIARLDSPVSFKQVGWMMDALDVSALEYRAQKPDGTWTPWEDVFVYWSEGIMHNAHIILDFATKEVQLRGGESIQSALFEFREESIARKNIVRAETGGAPEGIHDDLEGDLRTSQHAQAPESLVIPRSAWGAINPSKVCGSVVKPYRMTIHHTYRPSGDGGDAAARMRGMQSYHINTNGWCDIGYHFVVAQTGSIYQGRSRSDRPAAHTLNQNAGNVGISFIADFTTQTPTDTQFDAGARIAKWVHDTHGVPLTRTAVKGHREWPGQSTTCPGANMINRISTILTRAEAGGATPPPATTYDIKVEVNYLGLENFYTQGARSSLPDALPGDTFQAEILITNGSSGPLRGVELGYWFEEPFIRATNYVIETDHPELDKHTWKINSADGAEDNPPKAEMGQMGGLTMHAFGAGETKRVLIDLVAERYSIGFADHPDVRAWILNIDDVYAQATYGSEPTVNNAGSRLRAFAEMDVLSRDEWQFKSADTQDLEGWTGDGAEHYAALALNPVDGGLLTMNITGDDARFVSPEWTRIDADQYDQIAMTFRSHDGPHVKAIYWARDGESFSEERVVRFAAPGDSELNDFVIPVGLHAQWSGMVTRLRLDLMDDRAPVDNGWHGVGMIHFQDSDTLQTTSFTEGYLDQAPAELIGLEDVAPGSGDDMVLPPGQRPSFDGGPTKPSLGEDRSNYVTVNQGGCSTTGAPQMPVSAALLLAGLLATIVLRREIGADGRS